jgi:hypothetical protein
MRWWRARREVDRRGRPHEGFGRSAVTILVAVDTEHPDDDRHSPLLWATRQIL